MQPGNFTRKEAAHQGWSARPKVGFSFAACFSVVELIPEPIVPDKTKVVPGVQLIAYRESPDKTKVVPGVPELIPEVQSRVCFRSVQQIAQSNNPEQNKPLCN